MTFSQQITAPIMETKFRQQDRNYCNCSQSKHWKVPKDDTISTTSSLSKNSTSSIIFSPPGEKKTHNLYGSGSALKNKLKQNKMVISTETDNALKLWSFSKGVSKKFKALF